MLPQLFLFLILVRFLISKIVLVRVCAKQRSFSFFKKFFSHNPPPILFVENAV